MNKKRTNPKDHHNEPLSKTKLAPILQNLGAIH